MDLLELLDLLEQMDLLASSSATKNETLVSFGDNQGLMHTIKLAERQRFELWNGF